MTRRERYLLLGLALFYLAGAIGLGLGLHYLLE